MSYFWLWLYKTSIDILQTFSTTRGIFKTESNIYNKVFLWFSEKSSSEENLLGSKYASAYIYINLSPIETICIINTFAVKYLFLTKEWNKVAIRELK